MLVAPRHRRLQTRKKSTRNVIRRRKRVRYSEDVLWCNVNNGYFNVMTPRNCTGQEKERQKEQALKKGG
jgi:hypothetical protein